MNKHPFIFSDELKYRIRRHMAFWGFWWLFQAILYAFTPIRVPLSYMDRLPVSLVESFVFIWAHVFLSYSLMYFVLPRYLLRNKYWLTGIWVLILFVATAAISSFLSMYVIETAVDCLFPNMPFSHARAPSGFSFFLGLLAGLRGGITIGGLAAAIKLMKHWYIKEQRNLQLQKENVESQLQLLKAQVHPHFLFNTLNNIYSHTQGVAPVASQLVIGLSDMLRAILYECNQPLISLSKELKIVRDYISLEKVRYDEQFDIHIDLPEDTGNLHIAPLLLLPLVENCFKHGTSNMLEQPWLSLQVDLKGEVMHMKLMNGKAKLEDLPEKKSFGIGIQNVQKRLELLYPGKHKFVITDVDEVFVVDLELTLEKVNTVRKREDNIFVLTQHD